MRTLRSTILFLSLIVAAAAAPQAAEVQVTMGDFFFEPPVVAISSGDTVVWMNDGFIDHTSTSGVPGDPGVGSEWDTGLISPGLSEGVVFSGAGVFDYHCIPHPTLMLGQVIVDGTGVHGTMIPNETFVFSPQFQFSTWLFNFEAAPQNARVQIRVTAPTGQSATIVNVPLTLPAGAQLSRNLVLDLPATLPTGDYTVTLGLFDALGNLLITESDVYTRAAEAHPHGRPATVEDIHLRAGAGWTPR